MIFDTLENLSKYEAVLSGVKEAVRVLKETDLKSLEKGSYETQNKCCKYNINEYTSANDKRFEIHKKAADIQIVLSGTEKNGISAPLFCLPRRRIRRKKRRCVF